MIDNQCVRYITEPQKNQPNISFRESSQLMLNPQRQIKQAHIDELQRKYEISLQNYVREHQEKYSQLTIEKLELQDKVKQLESENRQLQVKLDSNLKTPYDVRKIISELEQNLLFSENQKRRLQTEMEVMKRTVHLRLLVQQQNLQEQQGLNNQTQVKDYKNPEIEMSNNELLQHIQELGSEKLSPKNYSLKISMLGKTIQQLKDELTARSNYYVQLENDAKSYKEKIEEISEKCDKLEIENKKIQIHCQGELENLQEQKQSESETLKKQISHYSSMYAASNTKIAELKEKYEARFHNQELDTDKIRHQILILENRLQKNAREYQEEKMEGEIKFNKMETALKKEIFDLNGKLENEYKKYIRLQNQHQDEILSMKTQHNVALMIIRNEKIKISETLRQKEVDYMKQIQHQERLRQQDSLKYSSIMKQFNVMAESKGSEEQVFEDQIKEMNKNLKLNEKEQERLKDKIDEYRTLIIDKDKLAKDKEEVIEKLNSELKEIKFSIEREKMKWDEQKQEEINQINRRYEQRLAEEEDRRVNELSRQRVELTNKIVRIEEKFKEKNNYYIQEFDKIKNIINTRNELVQVQYFDYQQESLLKTEKLLISQEIKVQKIEEQYESQIQQLIDKYEGDIKLLKEKHTREINSLIFKYEEEVKKPMLRQVQFYKEELQKIEQDMNIIKEEDSEFHILNEILKHCKNGEEADLQKENLKIITEQKNTIKSLTLDLEHSQQQKNMLGEENDALGKKIEILIEKLNKEKVDVETQCDFLSDELTYEINLRKKQEKELQLKYEGQIQQLARDQQELVKQFQLKHQSFIDLSEERYEDLKQKYDLLLEETYNYKSQCDDIRQECEALKEEIQKLEQHQKVLQREMDDRERLYTKLYQTEQDKQYQLDWKEEHKRIKRQLNDLHRQRYSINDLLKEKSDDNNGEQISSESEQDIGKSSPLRDKIKREILARQNSQIQDIKERYAPHVYNNEQAINTEETNKNFKNSKSKSFYNSKHEENSISKVGSKQLISELSTYNEDTLKEIKFKHETFKNPSRKSENINKFQTEQDEGDYLQQEQYSITKGELKRMSTIPQRKSSIYRISDTSDDDNATPQVKQRPNTSNQQRNSPFKGLSDQKRLSFDSLHAIIESKLTANITTSKIAAVHGNKNSQIAQLNRSSNRIMRSQTLTRVSSPNKITNQSQNMSNSSSKKVLKINKSQVNKLYQSESIKSMKTQESLSNIQSRSNIQHQNKTNTQQLSQNASNKPKPTYAELYKQIFNQRLNFEVRGVTTNNLFN